MENENGAVALKAPPASAAGASGWIVSPAFDLLFLANLGWLLAFVPGFVTSEGTVHLEFWQAYFITTPHRWITLGLVALDPDRREGRTGVFVALAVGAFAVVGGIALLFEKYFCLLIVADYLWNAWHFASQHHGVLRIYGRKVGGGWPVFERIGLRGFIFYVLAQTAGWLTGWLEAYPNLAAVVHVTDFAILSIPVLLLASAGLQRTPHSLPKLVYLLSVCGIYSSLLFALHTHNTTLIAALTVATAAFHAIEYLAIVTGYAWRRRTDGSGGLFQKMAGQWLGVLAIFVVFLGLSDVVLTESYKDLWLAVNLWAAFLHYTYDGMIWKLRRPATARALGIEIQSRDRQEAVVHSTKASYEPPGLSRR